MSDTIIVAMLSFAGTCIGSLAGISLIKYRIDQLEKKVEKHNSVVERTAIIENNLKAVWHSIDEIKDESKAVWHSIDEIKDELKDELKK